MANESLKIDVNNKPTAGAITDNASQEIRNLRIDDTTKGLKVMLVGGAGTGTVTSISQSTGILLTPNPIITTGTVALSVPLQPIASLSGNSLKVLRVNAGETAVEYVSQSASAGTVTSVSIVTANGVSGSVATASTTPAITLSLGSITPSIITVSSFTPGSILFAGTGGIFSQHNSNFFWDDANNQFQLGPSAGFDGNSQIQFSSSNNINNFSGMYEQNKSSGTSASTDIILGADNDGVALTGHFIDMGMESSTYSNVNFTLYSPNDGYLYTSGGNMIIGTDSGVAGKVIIFHAGGTLTTNEVGRLSTSGLSLGLTGTTLGKIIFAGSTSTSITLQGQAVGSSSVLTLPTGTDTLTGKATTDIFTNKTYDTAGTGNVFKINGTGITAITGSGSVVLATNPTIAKPVINARNQTAQTYGPAGGGTATLDLSLADQHYVTFPAGNITIALSNDTNNQIFLVSLTQDSGGNRTVTWFTTIKWAGGATPTLTTTANKRDTFGFIRTGSGTYDGFIIGQNI